MLTGQHREGLEVLRGEQRRQQCLEGHLEQIRCVVVIQLVFQPLKEGGALMRSWLKAPVKVTLPLLWASVSSSAKW